MRWSVRERRLAGQLKEGPDVIADPFQASNHYNHGILGAECMF